MTGVLVLAVVCVAYTSGVFTARDGGPASWYLWLASPGYLALFLTVGIRSDTPVVLKAAVVGLVSAVLWGGVVLVVAGSIRRLTRVTRRETPRAL